MNRKSRSVKATSFFGDKSPINCANLVPPSPLTKPIELEDDLRFLVLDVNARDTNYTHWISPDTTDRTILELYSLLYLLNRIFYHADKKCCLFVQQKERLVPGNLLVRKEIVVGHMLYFGFDRQVFEELLPTCLTLALMINANYLDARRLFVSPLCLDVLKTEAATFNVIKGVGISMPGTGTKGQNVAGVFGSFKTLSELRNVLMAYHRVSLAQADTEDSDDEGGGSSSQPQERGRYDQLRQTMSHLLPDESLTEFAIGLTTLLSGPFLFERSFRMTQSYREMRDLFALNGRDIGLDDSQIRDILSSNQADLIRTIRQHTEEPALAVQTPVLLDCVQNAVKRYHWEHVFRVGSGNGIRFCFDLTGGIGWRVLEEHMRLPFDTPLYTMVFPRERIDKGTQRIKDYIDQASLDKMDDMRLQLEAYSAVTARERGGEIADVKSAVAYRQGAIEDVARKYPLFADMRTLLDKLAEVLQPGSKVSELYRGSFSGLIGKLIEDGVRNPNKQMSRALQSLADAYPTLVDRRRNFHGLHLNSLKNDYTGRFVMAVHNPFDPTIETSDGLLINDFFTYMVACHSQLPVETMELRLAVTSGVAIDGKNIWVGWQGPAGSGKTTCAKSVLHGISASDGLCIRGMVREMDSTTTASLKSLNDDPLLHCNGVAFINELNDGGNDKSGTLKDDSSEKSTLMKNFFDSGMSAVYRARVDEASNEVRQNVQHVIFECVFVALANSLGLCRSLTDRMVIHAINKKVESTSDRMTVTDIFRRMDRFKVGHYEILKLLVISLVSMFEFVGCTLEDTDYLTDMERLVFQVIDKEFRDMNLDANFLGRGRLLDNIRSLARMLAMHRAVLTVLGCVDTFRSSWQEHDPSTETLDQYNQRMMQLVVDDLERMSLHELVRRVQEVYCPSPADYIAIVTMECLDQNPYFPVFRALAISVIDPANLEKTSDGRNVFVVPNMSYGRLCDVLNDQRIPFESKEIRSILEAMTNSIAREGIPVITVTNQQGSRSNNGGNFTSSFQLAFDARMAAEVVIESVMMDLVNHLTEDIQDRITKVVDELAPGATRDPRFTNEMIKINTGDYGTRASRFFGFLGQIRPNGWTLRYAKEVVQSYDSNTRSVLVSVDFNHARVKLMTNWMVSNLENPKNVRQKEGYVRVRQMNQCAVLVATIVDLQVRDTFENGPASTSDNLGLLPFYQTGSTVYVHQAIPMLRLGTTEDVAARLRGACSPPNYPIEYWTFDARKHPRLLESLKNTSLSRIDTKYTTTADALVCEQDLDGRSSGAWLHVSLLSRLTDMFRTSLAISPEVPREFVRRCMRRHLTDRKTVLYFNKRGTGPALDVVKVDEVRSAYGGQLPSVELPRQKERDFVTASLAMMQEGHTTTLGIKSERLVTFPRQHETRYITRKYLASSGKLSEIEESCTREYENDFRARDEAIQNKVEALTEEWLDRVRDRYRPLRLGPPMSSVQEFMAQDGEQTRKQNRGVKRKI